MNVNIYSCLLLTDQMLKGGSGLVSELLVTAVCETNQFWPPRLHVVWLLLFKWTSRLQTGHKWLRCIQSHIIEIPCKRLGALNMWWAFHVSGELPMGHCSVLHLFVGKCLKVTCRIACLTPFEDVVSPRLKITMQILLSGPSSGEQGLSYQHIYHLWTYALHPVPPAKSSPPLLHYRLIFCVSELWIVVLPHCNKQMAARSWVITNPLREWLVLSRAALIRARWLSPVFAEALKSSSGFVTHCVCSG